jgi:hypothetical protein
MRNTLDVTLRIDDIVCHDEGDGPGTAEPYLWVCFYKIDGTTCRLGADGKLAGHAVVQRMEAYQGNLGTTDVDAGETVRVPGVVGYWQTRLTPIQIDPAWKGLIKEKTGQDDLPGTVGVLWVLMEEDNLPSGSSNAGYSSLCATFETEMNNAIATLGVFNPEIKPELEKVISDAVTAAVTRAITDDLNLIQKIWQWLAGPDDTLGSGSFRATHGQLIEKGTIPFGQRWKNGVNVGGGDVLDVLIAGPGRFIQSGGEWEIRGHATAKEIVHRTFEVTCIRSGSLSGKPYRISQLGVRDENGVASVMTKGEVMTRIGQGDRFFVRDAAGHTSWVRIHEPAQGESIRYRHLTTTSDGIPTNNLTALPQCR